MKMSASCSLKEEPDANAQTRSGKASSLHRAAYSGHATVVKILIKHGADPKLGDCDGQTALHKVHQIYRDHAGGRGRGEGGGGEGEGVLVPPLFVENIINLVKYISKIEKYFHRIIVVS